jgi:hypothetical protein
MRVFLTITFLTLLVLAGIASLPPVPGVAAAGDDDFLGKWDITVPPAGKVRGRACWLDLTRENGALKGLFQPGGGAAFPLPTVSIESGELRFQHSQRDRFKEFTAFYRAKIRNGRLEGTVTFGEQQPRPWTGVRAPVWPAQPPKVKAGKPVELFNGKDTAGWLGQYQGKPTGWSVQNGILVNSEEADNIYSEKKFMNFQVALEFNVAKESNSGLYLRGRYELQIRDSQGQPLDVHSQGALYGFTVPSVNASKAAGEWQTLNATIVANRVTVILNGTKIIDDVVIPGITGGALDANEAEPGPIMIQGDHGKVEIRKVTITPLE